MLPHSKQRAREIGLRFGGTPGPLNAITDVPHITVGLKSIVEEAPRSGRRLPVRTGVTAIVPWRRGGEPRPIYAGIHRFNGNGEMTGSHWIEDGGYFVGPVLITNTHSVGMAHHTAIRWLIERYPEIYEQGDNLWIMPVVAETYDGRLNDINGQHVTAEHVIAALDGASGGAVAEGNTGGGTGMIAYGFKGGTGTSSRRLDIGGTEYTVGVLVQANHGRREWLTIAGIAVGERLGPADPTVNAERGSIIVVVATDLPAAPHQLKRIARRCAIGIGRNGTPGGNGSGDIFLALSTANALPLPHRAPALQHIAIVNDELFDAVYMAVVEATEEAVLNAMLAAEPSGGTLYDQVSIPALDPDRLMEALRSAPPSWSERAR